MPLLTMKRNDAMADNPWQDRPPRRIVLNWLTTTPSGQSSPRDSAAGVFYLSPHPDGRPISVPRR